jgi:hypothetical protein
MERFLELFPASLSDYLNTNIDTIDREGFNESTCIMLDGGDGTSTVSM